jgi:hypothetical protein
LFGLVSYIQQGSEAAIEIERSLEILKGKSNEFACLIQGFGGQHQREMTAAVVGKLKRGPTL